MGRHDHGGDRQFPGDVGAVQRARASKRDESEVTRIIAAADGDQPHRVRHIGVRHADDGVRGLFKAELEGLGDACAHRFARLFGVEVDASGELRAEPAEGHVGVRIGGHRIAVAVAGRAGIRAGRLWAVAQAARLVDPGQ